MEIQCKAVISQYLNTKLADCKDETVLEQMINRGDNFNLLKEKL